MIPQQKHWYTEGRAEGGYLDPILWLQDIYSVWSTFMWLPVSNMLFPSPGNKELKRI